MLEALAIFTTALSVSSDTFIVGMNLAYQKTSFFKYLYMSLLTAALCGAGTILSNLMDWDYQVLLGGALLVSLGIYNTVTAFKTNPEQPVLSAALPKLTALTLILGLDNASIAAMLVLVGYNAIIVTILFGVACLTLLLLGSLLSKVIKPKTARLIFMLAGILLIILGAYKITEYLIVHFF